MWLNTEQVAVRRSNNSTKNHINYSLYFQVLILTYISRLVAAVSGSLVISSPFTSSAIRKKQICLQKQPLFFVGDLWYLDEPGLQLKTLNQEEINK
jgi:hypothetical protein